jgi:hypothetical protein
MHDRTKGVGDNEVDAKCKCKKLAQTLERFERHFLCGL